jgi:endonuclease/exonuclease/phosphatase family metal-dependent hydrolase
MTFNVRGSYHRDGDNAWNRRAPLNVQTIKSYRPHLIGFQELQDGNLETYKTKLPEYGFVLGLRAGNKAPYEFNAIFFDLTRLEVLASGGFWLSTTPDRHSSSWQTKSIRSANWASLRCLNTGLSFLHLNTHLDHVSRAARGEGSKLILRKIAELQNVQERGPQIITGNFNCAPGSLPHRNFMENGFMDTCLGPSDENTEASATFHGFKGRRYSGCHRLERLDWILLKDCGQCIWTRSAMIARDCDEEAGIYPSDHYPVLAELVLSKDRAPTSHFN